MMVAAGALFDWDGVVIDSSAAHERSWEMLAEEENLPLEPGQFERGFGKKNKVIIPEVYQWADDPQEIQWLGERKEFLYRELIARDGIELLPGVVELLEFFREQGIPCAVGSSAPRENLELIMDTTGTREFFVGMVGAEDVDRGKPDPEVFIKAAGTIDREPEHCFVFEDALHGIEAGLAAGAKVVAVATTNPLDKLGIAHMAVHRLNLLDYTKMMALLR